MKPKAFNFDCNKIYSSELAGTLKKIPVKPEINA